MARVKYVNRPPPPGVGHYTAQLRPVMYSLFTRYKPQEQETGRFRLVRGKTPEGISDDTFIKAYNNADSKLRRSKNWSTVQAIAARENGKVREEAIKMLKQKGILAKDFIDSDI